MGNELAPTQRREPSPQSVGETAPLRVRFRSPSDSVLCWSFEYRFEVLTLLSTIGYSPSFRLPAMSRQLPVPTVLASQSYMTEQQALLELYAGHGLSQTQRNQLETVVQQTIANVQNIYSQHSYFPVAAEEQRAVKATIDKAKRR
jgi:hypothetical protein